MAMAPVRQPAMESLPAWARQLSEKYYSRTIALFVLYGNVRDVVPFRRGGATEFLPLTRFLNEALFGQRDLIMSYDRGGGLTFANPAMQADFSRAMTGYDSFHGTNYAAALPRNPDGVLNLLDNYLRLRIADGKRIALAIDFAETIAPAGDVSSMSAEDRNALVILKRWANNPAFQRADVTICLIAENQIELNPGIVQHPGVAAIAIPMPDEAGAAGVCPATVGQYPLAGGFRRYAADSGETGRGAEARATPDPDIPGRPEPPGFNPEVPGAPKKGFDRGGIRGPAGIRGEPIRPIHGGGERPG